MKDSIFHSSLISADVINMASDLNIEKRVESNTVHLCINCNIENELNSLFSKLWAGGDVTETVSRYALGCKVSRAYVVPCFI